MANILKTRPKNADMDLRTENQGLKDALVIQRGEKMPKIQIKRNRTIMGYADLERMTLRDLAECDVMISGVAALFCRSIRPPLGTSESYSFLWAANAGSETEIEYKPHDSAVSILENVYKMIYKR